MAGRRNRPNSFLPADWVLIIEIRRRTADISDGPSRRFAFVEPSAIGVQGVGPYAPGGGRGSREEAPSHWVLADIPSSRLGWKVPLGFEAVNEILGDDQRSPRVIFHLPPFPFSGAVA